MQLWLSQMLFLCNGFKQEALDCGFRCSYDGWRFLIIGSGAHILEVAASAKDSEQSSHSRVEPLVRV